MFRFIPHDQAFFDLFTRAASNVHAGARALVEFLERFDDITERAKRIKDLEHAGDELTHETIERLNKTFVTPLDREDIHQLTARLDDVLDMIDTAVNRMVLYKIKAPTKDAIQLAQCLVHQTALLQEVMPLLQDLRDTSGMMQKVRMIHTQENEADRIEQHALASLFETGVDPIEVIKWKDIYQELEAATDRCEDVANIIEGIILKNA